MFTLSSYHYLESLVPPSLDEYVSTNESLLRLEALSACVVVRNKRSCQLLSNIPTMLHTIVWRAYLRDEYYAHRDRLAKYNTQEDYSEDDVYDNPGTLAYGLPELLSQWPHEEFILKEVMPKLPPRLDHHSHINYFGSSRAMEFSSYFRENEKYLLSFYESVVESFVKMFKMWDDHKSMEISNKRIPKKINLSGFYVFKWFRFKDDFIFMQSPFTQNCAGKIELVVDIDIGEKIADVLDLEDNEIDLHSLRPWGPSSHNLSKSISLKFGHVSLLAPEKAELDCWGRTFGPCPMERFPLLFEILLNIRPTSITVGGNFDAMEVIEDISTATNKEYLTSELSNENLTNITALSLPYPVDRDDGLDQEDNVVPSLIFLQYFCNLTDLNLSWMNLHDRLEFLNHMHNGLVCLKLSSCDLKNEDLNHLIGSCHQQTLRELNLSGNSFGNGTNLINLCKKFSNMIKLDLCSCELSLWQTKDIALLVDAFIIMPKIVYLSLYGNSNYFSKDIIKLHIMRLGVSPSLRYLTLAYSSSYGIAFSYEIKTNMNKNRSQLLYIAFD